MKIDDLTNIDGKTSIYSIIWKIALVFVFIGAEIAESGINKNGKINTSIKVVFITQDRPLKVGRICL